MILSDEQKRAVMTDGNLIVSAGAGCGKTATMIERILRLISDGVPLEKMLIVTFTRAAASEIRVKLAARLAEGLKAAPNDCKLRAAVDAMPISNIGTLHSFCQRLIRTYFFAAELDPSAAVADADEAELIENSCVAAAVRDGKSNDADFAVVCDMLLDRRSDRGAISIVTELVDFALSMPDPEEFLTRPRRDEDFYEFSDRAAQAALNAARAECDALNAHVSANGPELYLGAADKLFAYAAGADSTAIGYPSSKRDAATVAANAAFKRTLEACKAARAAVDAARAARSVDSAPYVTALCRIALDAIARYSAKKAELGKLDYSDLEHGARKILADPSCLAEIAGRIEYVFIDEYQDVNPLQAEIAERFRLSGAQMFLVGDVKQSIYAFRRCNPKFFAQTLKSADYTRVDLTANYRSVPEIIDFVNDVFSGVMTEDFGGVDYSDGHALRSMSSSHGAAEFVVIDEQKSSADGGDKKNKKTSDKSETEPYSVIGDNGGDRIDREAAYIVQRVLEWIDPCGEERASLGQIAVLLRSTNTDFCKALVNMFAQNGVPCNVTRKSGLADFPEAAALLDIARCADNRFDDVALYTALRSPLGGFSDGELAEIAADGERTARKRGVKPHGQRYMFWQKAECYRGRLSARLEAFYAEREKIAMYARCRDASDTLGFITSHIDYFQHVYENGGTAEAIESLISTAAARGGDLHSFIAFCDSADIALDCVGGGDAVTVTTEHSAKGLEYDYVVVADLAHGINMRDAQRRVILTEEGIGVKYPDTSSMTLVPSAPWLALHDLLPKKIRAEELRLFYVALTRAKKRLLVTGKIKKRHESEDAVSMLDFLHALPETVAVDACPQSAVEKRSEEVREDIRDAVAERCSFVYRSEEKPIKTCVTALATDGEYRARILTDDDKVDGVPDLGSSADSEKSRLRGTAYHRIMELIDFDAPDFDGAAKRTDNSELVDRSEIMRAAQAMKELTSGAVFVARERPFCVDMPIDNTDGADGGHVLVQGIIDLFAVYSDGSAVIVDYKTTARNRLINDGYKTQLKLYAAAVEKCTPYRIASAYLYSFECGLVKIDLG